MSPSMLTILTLAGCSEECGLYNDRTQRLSLYPQESQEVAIRVVTRKLDNLVVEAEGPVEAVFDNGLTKVNGPVDETQFALTITCLTPGTGKVTVSDVHDRGSTDCSTLYEVTCLEGGTTTTETVTTTETTTPTVTTTPTEIPPGETDCTLDVDGCVVSDGTACSIALDTPLTTDRATVTVAGTAVGGAASSAIDVGLFTAVDLYSAQGPICSVYRDDVYVIRNLLDVDRLILNDDDLSAPAGEVSIGIGCTVDNAVGTIAMDTTIANTSAPPLEAAGMSPASDDLVIVTLWNTRVCEVSVQQD